MWTIGVSTQVPPGILTCCPVLRVPWRHWDGLWFFSTLELASGYLQVIIDEEDWEKMALVTPMGLYKFLWMRFWLNNASASFQRLIEL